MCISLPTICWRPMPSVDNLLVKKISATNMQENNVTQLNDQYARASAVWGQALAKNGSSQEVPNKQVGDAYNNIKLSSSAWKSNVEVSKIDATNLQSNTVGQSNLQKAISQTMGFDPAKNWSSQLASNLQIGSAYNNINIQA